MAEEGSSNQKNADAGAAQQFKFQVLGQFIRDLSFENVVAQKNTGSEAVPDINVQVGLEAKKRQADHQFEVICKYTITSKTKDAGENLFLLELEYGGIFHIENVPNEQLHPFLMIECPRMLFPFVRRIVHDVVRDGGFPPLNLENVDWVELFRQNVARQAEAAKAAQAAANGDATKT